ncbi:MAG: hypothetical protein Q9168_000036 [Polycauliona sp. 1 TL-2023]
MAINASQFLGAPLYLINEEWYNSWIAFTKQSWGLLTASMTQCWAPTVVRVSGHKSVRGELMRTTDGDLLSNFPERMILIANHQIYTDWLYLWWIGYTNGMHGRIYVVLKESLRRIPVIGWGMQFSQFIFLKRNWEEDKDSLAAHLQKLNDALAPMWLMLFPEGTNLHPDTRKASKKWADKNKIPDMQHQLLPRSKGLQFCIQQLRKTVPYVYDCTIAYEGVPTGQYASEIFTINAAYFGGKPPKSVNMYWRRFDIWSIPVDNDRDFDNWLRARWIEKDQLLENYQRTGRFPADTGVSKSADGRKHRGAGYIETEIKSNKWYEYLQIFAPVGMLAFVLYMFYGGLPKRFMKDIGQRAVEQSQLEGPENLEQMINSAPRIVEVDSTNASVVGAPSKIHITSQTPAAAKKAIRKLGPKQSGARSTGSKPKPVARPTVKKGRKAKKLTVNNAANSKAPKAHVKSEVGAVSKPPETSQTAASRSAGETPKKLEVRHGPDATQANTATPKKLKPVATSTPKKLPLQTRNDRFSNSAQPAAPKLQVKQPKLAGNRTKAKSAPANDKKPNPPKKLEIKPKSDDKPSTK